MFSNGFLLNLICERIICEFHQPRNWSLPSMFKSAGQNFFILSSVSRAAQLDTPESNHTSKTSGTLDIFDLHFLQEIVMLSISGLWISLIFVFESFSSSLIEPTTIFSPHLQVQIGRGVPQYLSLDTGQSEIPSSHAFILTFMYFGTQFVFSFSLRICFWISEIFRNH